MRNKSILLFIFACSCLSLQAQISSSDSTILNSILSKNKQYRSIQSSFRHDRVQNGKAEHRYGTLYCEKVKAKQKGDVEAKISMLYTVPQNEYYVITTTHLYNGICGHNWNFNYKKIPLMKLLGNAMAWSVNGDIYSLYNNFNVKLQISSDANYYTINLTSGKGFNKGISRLVLKYNKTNGLIYYLEMEEKMGTTHKYYMGTNAKGEKQHPLVNTPIDQSVYIVK